MLVVAVTAGCSGSAGTADPGSSASPASPAAAESSSPSSPAAGGVSLAESCPLVEAAIPPGVAAAPAEWAVMAGRLDEVAAAGDAQTQSAVADLQAAVDAMAADPGQGPPYVAAFSALLDALDVLAKRCAAVGSTALQ